MGLSGSGRSNEGKIPVSVDCRQGRQAFQPAGIPALNERKVEIVKGLGIFQRQSAHFQQGMDGGVHLLLPQMFQNLSDSCQLAF